MIRILSLHIGIIVCSGTLASQALGSSQELTPDNVSVTGDRELTFNWANQGTLICNGLALNPIVSLPEELTYGPASECWVQFATSRSNTLNFDCQLSKCVVSSSGVSKDLVFETSDSLESRPPIEAAPISELTVVEIDPADVQTEAIDQSPASELTVLDLPSDHFAVQLAALPDQHHLANYVRDHQLDDTLKVPVEANGRVLLAVVAGTYPTYEEAVAASRMTAKLNSSSTKPWIRSVGSLQNATRRADEVRQRKKSGAS